VLWAFGFGRQAATIGATSLLLSIALSILGLQLFGLAGALLGTIAGLVLWEWWALIKVAKALGTSISLSFSEVFGFYDDRTVSLVRGASEKSAIKKAHRDCMKQERN
jgi:hypothetical protein